MAIGIERDEKIDTSGDINRNNEGGLFRLERIRKRSEKLEKRRAQNSGQSHPCRRMMTPRGFFVFDKGRLAETVTRGSSRTSILVHLFAFLMRFIRSLGSTLEPTEDV